MRPTFSPRRTAAATPPRSAAMQQEHDGPTPCTLCRRPLMHTGLPLFWRLSITRMGTTAGVCRPLVGQPAEAYVCEDCATTARIPLAQLNEVSTL